MAQSVTIIATNATTNRNEIRIGGTVVASAWATGAQFYTVPPGKRLVLKTPFAFGPSGSGAASEFTFNGTELQEERTVVLGAGSVLRSDGNASTTHYASGFIEDDV